jgi:O-antigen/teichoic acid export membrane protein
MTSLAYSFGDQALAVGGTFLGNIVLARSQTKEEYGTFALSYSVYTFLAALHNSAILEPCTVYGSGRYQNRFSQYLRLMVRVNGWAALVLTGLALLSCVALHWLSPRLLSPSLLGLSTTVGVLLSGGFLRRIFYLQRQPRYAAKASLFSFITIAAGLSLTSKAGVLNGFSVFLVFALGWIAAGIGVGKRVILADIEQPFLQSEPDYWRSHWQYSRWVFATALVFQLATQGYYWLLAGLLSVKEVAELRAMYLVIAPVDQVFVATSLLFLPALASLYSARRIGAFLSLSKRFWIGILSITVVFSFLVRAFGKPVMHLLYAGKFDGIVPLLYILGLLPLLTGIGTTMSSTLNAMEKPKFVFCGYAISGAVTFLAGIPLVNHFGLRGAAYGMLLSAATCTTALVAGFLFAVYPPGKLSRRVSA